MELGHIDLNDLYMRIRNAYDRIKPHIRKTPLEYSQHLSKLGNANVYLKLGK